MSRDEKESEALLIPRPQAQSSITPPWQFLSVCLYASLLSLSLFLSFLPSFMYPYGRQQIKPFSNPCAIANTIAPTCIGNEADRQDNKIEANQEGEERTRGEETSQELLYTTQLGHTIGEESSYQSRATISIFFCYRTDPGRTWNPTKSFVYFRDLYICLLSRLLYASLLITRLRDCSSQEQEEIGVH